MPPKPKRKRRILLIVLLTLLLTLVVAVWFIMRGMHPLENGQRLAEGRIETIADGFIGCYIVDLSNGKLALVDAGFDPEGKAIIDALEQRGQAEEEVVAIFLTHGHGDHIAGALRFPNASVYALSSEIDLVEGRRVAGSPFASGRVPEPTGVEVDRALSDGDVFVVEQTRIEVFAVPGHTLGSAVYLIHGVLFMGDSAAAHAGGGITGAPPVFSTDRSMNRIALIELAERLSPRKNEILSMAFGHQAPLPGLTPLLEWADANR